MKFPNFDLNVFKVVESDVIENYTIDDIKEHESFEKFYEMIDCHNAYESEWDKDYYKPYYEKVYNNLLKQKSINVLGRIECHDCGINAGLKFVEYMGMSLELCDDCLEKREDELEKEFSCYICGEYCGDSEKVR